MLNTPYAKFVTPAVLAIVVACLAAIQNGEFDLPALQIGFYGLVAATVTFLVTNGPKGLRRFTKALAPALLALVGLGLDYLFTDTFNEGETRAAIAMGLAALVSYAVPNAGAIINRNREVH